MASNGDHASPSAAAAEHDSAAATTTTTSAAAMDAMRDLNLRMSKKVAQLTKVISHLNARSEEQLFDLQDMSQHYESEMEVRPHPHRPPLGAELPTCLLPRVVVMRARVVIATTGGHHRPHHCGRYARRPPCAR